MVVREWNVKHLCSCQCWGEKKVQINLQSVVNALNPNQSQPLSPTTNISLLPPSFYLLQGYENIPKRVLKETDTA